MSGLYDLIENYVPNDCCVQVNAMWYARRVISRFPNKVAVLDVGCGTGYSVDIFRNINPEVTYVGVDIEGSPEAKARVRNDFEFHQFDGTTLPFLDKMFDIIYSSQVLEHVRYPEPLLQEIFRVLKPGGFFIGAVSYLQPYHSFSIFNFTPYGFIRISLDSGFIVQELRPGIDSITLIKRQYTADINSYNKYFTEMSPINMEILKLAKERSTSIRATNIRMLEFCGIFGFQCKKPGGSF